MLYANCSCTQLIHCLLADMRVIGVQVRGKGLLNALVIEELDGIGAKEICLQLKDNGLLVRLSHHAITILSLTSQANAVHDMDCQRFS